MNDILFTIVQVIVIICSILFVRFVIPLLKEKLNQKQYEQIKTLVNDAVFAVEQLIGAGKGTEKKEEVITFVMNYIVAKGINITRKQVDILIESAVFVMNREKNK
jgi:LL-H family phage holin